jgi:hypothetical protein
MHYTTHSTTRQLLLALCLYAGLTSQHGALATDETSITKPSSIVDIVADDYKSYFKRERLLRLGIAFGAAGIVANTNMDMAFRNWYQENVRSERTDCWASDPTTDLAFNAKFFGEGKYMVPAALLAASVNYIDADTAVGNWGANASRAYIVGLPAMWAMQRVTGASRPGETPEGSIWRPFNDDNGVSGHAYIGAVPFLTIASMNPENNWIKYPAYIASAAAGWSRVNDDAHFLSQVFLGWYMAWEAVDSVFENNEKKKKGVTVAPMAGLDGFGIMAKGTW